MHQWKRVWAVIIAIVFILTISGTVWAKDTEKININTATVEQLVQLQRIGPSYAAKIIEYRKANGPFEKPEDIMKVSGIGPKTFEVNKDRISIE